MKSSGKPEPKAVSVATVVEPSAPEASGDFGGASEEPSTADSVASAKPEPEPAPSAAAAPVSAPETPVAVPAANVAPSPKPAKSKSRARSRAGLEPNNVRKLRQEAMMSKAELARRAGVSPLTIDRVEAGCPSRMDTKRKILEALGLKPSARTEVWPDMDA
ncbi:transcriptional regulator, XRE family protein [Plesiocystis pacifica SIR-1]|uniref:Transcriptional regulator, XRE family protein n=1 Tax=Plesiocystis pacifica SIR-1 TaxID=391625 RepID=A6GHB2_9BACT|nr:transcriptional regulator, XRE family protein [Plesiocystis pacifica SIR-1]